MQRYVKRLRRSDKNNCDLQAYAFMASSSANGKDLDRIRLRVVCNISYKTHASDSAQGGIVGAATMTTSSISHVR